MFKKLLFLCLIVLFLLTSCTDGPESARDVLTETSIPVVEVAKGESDYENISKISTEDFEVETYRFSLPVYSIESELYSSICEYTEYGDTVEYYHTETGKDTVSVEVTAWSELGTYPYVAELNPPQFRALVSNLGLTESEQDDSPFFNAVHNSVLHYYYYNHEDSNGNYFVTASRVVGLDIDDDPAIELEEITNEYGEVVWDKNMSEGPREINPVEWAYINYRGGWDTLFDSEELSPDSECSFGSQQGPDVKGWYVFENWSIYESRARSMAALQFFMDEDYWVSIKDEYFSYDISGETRWVDSSGDELIPEEGNSHVFFIWAKWNTPITYEILKVPEDGWVILQTKSSSTESSDWEDIAKIQVARENVVRTNVIGEISVSRWMSLTTLGKHDSLDNLTFDWSEDKILEYFLKYEED